MVGDHCTHLFWGGSVEVLRGGKLGGNVWVVALLGFMDDAVIFIAVATF